MIEDAINSNLSSRFGINGDFTHKRLDCEVLLEIVNELGYEIYLDDDPESDYYQNCVFISYKDRSAENTIIIQFTYLPKISFELIIAFTINQMISFKKGRCAAITKPLQDYLN